MINEIKGLLVEMLTNEIDSIKYSEEYRGELEEDAEWIPVFPIGFVQIGNVSPIYPTDDRMSVGDKVAVTIRVGNEYDASSEGYDVYDYFRNRIVETEEGQKYWIVVKQMTPGGWIKRVNTFNVMLEIEKL